MTMFSHKIQIENRTLGDDAPVFVIAEAGVNHDGDLSIARKLVDVAVQANADAVKFQAFRADHLILKTVGKAPYQKRTTSSRESQYEMLKRLEMSEENNWVIQQYCKDNGIIFLTTPFDEESLEDVLKLQVPAIKVASTDLTNIPFLRKVAASGLPIFLSTGMSYLSEVEQAVRAIGALNEKLVLMQCTANYPIADDEANLAVLDTYKKFNCLLGYSDHSTGMGAAPFAIPMGARVVEKHFTLNKTEAGPDHAASLSPEELKEFVSLVRTVERYIGSKIKQPSLSEMSTRAALQKCLVAAQPIKAGECFTAENLVAKRTGGVGISPLYFDELLNRRAEKDFMTDEVISL